MLFFTDEALDAEPNATPFEMAWPVVFPNNYVTHRRDSFGVERDLMNRADNMPQDVYNPNPSQLGDIYSKKLPAHFALECPPGGGPEFSFAYDSEIRQLGGLGRDLSYMRMEAEVTWRQRSKKEHIDTWTRDM